MDCHAISRHDSGQPLGPRGRVIVSSSFQHLEHRSVHPVGLAIALRVEGSRVRLVNTANKHNS